jgi:hypothetical protein
MSGFEQNRAIIVCAKLVSVMPNMTTPAETQSGSECIFFCARTKQNITAAARKMYVSIVEPKNRWEVDKPSKDATINAPVEFSSTPFINIHARKTHAAPAKAVRMIAAKCRSPFKKMARKLTDGLSSSNASGCTERQ